MKELYTTFLSENYPNFNDNGYLYQLIENRKLIAIKHNHNFFEMLMILRGNATHNIDGNAFVMQELEFVFLNPSATHFFENQSEDAYVFSLSITSEKFTRILSAFEFSPIYGQIYKVKNRRLIKQLSHLPSANIAHQKFLINSIIAAFFSEIIDNNLPYDNEIPRPLQNALEKIREPEYIRGGVEKLAELAGYSRMHLGRLTQKYYGKKPSQLLHDIRMNLAAEYLVKTSFTLEKIAEDIGFSSLSQFYVVFKRQYNCTPNSYRKKNLQTIATTV